MIKDLAVKKIRDFYIFIFFVLTLTILMISHLMIIRRYRF